ncbi:MAG: 4a-hydroxytetrahydrobiopterin dehydratase [Flavobacterium sp.]|jgi:4a-hydroxytetrahydrobiopterin dehydratase
MNKYTILTNEEIVKALVTLPGWDFNDNHIFATFEFSNFKVAYSFMTHVAFECEVLNHHPELTNTYNKVSFSLTTHSADNKVTSLDIKLAGLINSTAKKFG